MRRTIVNRIGKGIGIVVCLLMIVGGINLVKDGLEFQNYQAGRCTIRAKQLLSEPGTTAPGLPAVTVYRPDFEFLVQTADGHHYQAHGYRYNTPYSDQDQSSAQAIIDQYEIGKTYPCWYDPADPTQAVLTREFSWVDNLWPIAMLPLFVSIVVVIFMVAFIINRFKRQRHHTPRSG